MRRHVYSFLLILLAFNTGWFVVYAARLGWQGFALSDPSQVSRVYFDGAWITNLVLAAHMVAGGILTVAAPLQATPLVRGIPKLHRASGRVLLPLAIVTGIGGLIYIGVQGTIGGWWMSL